MLVGHTEADASTSGANISIMGNIHVMLYKVGDTYKGFHNI